MLGFAGCRLEAGLRGILILLGARGLSASGGALTAHSANFRHMLAVLAHPLPAFATGLAGLVGGELMRRFLLMGGPTAFAGDFSLFFRVHGCKAAITGPFHIDLGVFRRKPASDRKQPAVALSLDKKFIAVTQPTGHTTPAAVNLGCNVHTRPGRDRSGTL